jgi:hypothetical protein
MRLSAGNLERVAMSLLASRFWTDRTDAGVS